MDINKMYIYASFYLALCVSHAVPEEHSTLTAFKVP